MTGFATCCGEFAQSDTVTNQLARLVNGFSAEVATLKSEAIRSLLGVPLAFSLIP